MAEEGTSAMSAYLLTLASGLSTGLGGLLVVLCGIPSASRVGMMQSFAGGLMIAVSVIELLRPALSIVGAIGAILWFFVGVGFMYAIAQLIPDHDHPAMADVEHELVAMSKEDHGDDEIDHEERQAFFHVGIVTAVGISMHNFPEGMAVFLSSLKTVEYGFILAIAIALHNIPEGVAVAAPIYKSSHSATKAVWASLLSGLFEPLGALLAGLFLHQYLTDFRLNVLYCIVAGVMICMSVSELIPVSLKHAGARNTALSIVAGFTAFAMLELFFEQQ